GLVDEADDRVLDEVGGEALFRAALRVDEQPTQMGVEEALELRPHALAVADVGAVRVALLIGEGVVLAVVRDPGDHGPLDRSRAAGGDHSAHPGEGLEAPMGEEAVEADSDPEPGRDVDDREDDQVAPVQPSAGELPDDEPEHQEGHHREQAGDDPVPRLVLHRLNCGSQRAVDGVVRGTSPCDRPGHQAATLAAPPKPCRRDSFTWPRTPSRTRSSARSRSGPFRSSSGTAPASPPPTAAAQPSGRAPRTRSPTRWPRRASWGSVAP